jgi:ABC-type glycerol-3-phosphate transport system permease component
MISNVERTVKPVPIVRTSSAHTQRLTWLIIIYALVIAGAVVSMIPFYWTVISSGKEIQELYRYPPTFWPEHSQYIANYSEILARYPFGRWFINSFYVTFMALLGTTISATLVAYGFARFRVPGRDTFFFITLATIMLPVEVTLIPTYLLFKQFGWIDTFLPLIVPAWFGGGAFNIFLMRQFIMGIPFDLDEAAKLDGASSWRILWQIIVPLCKPAIATMVTLGFIGQWNSFLYPLIFLNSEDKYVVAVGLRYLQSALTQGSAVVSRPQDNLLMAASLMMTAPCLILFFLGQRYFIQGIVTTGIKG